MNQSTDPWRDLANGQIESTTKVGAGTRPNQGGRPDALAEIAEQRRNFAGILLNGHHAALAPLFTADTLLLPAGKPPVCGREAAIAFWTKASSDPDRRLRSEFHPIDTIFADGLAIEAGRASVFAMADDGARQIDSGKYIVVWKHEDDRWKRHRDIYNSDGPTA